MQRVEACGLWGVTADHNLRVAFDTVAYGHSSDHCEQYGRLADSTTHVSLKMSCQGVVNIFEDILLRLSNEDELVGLSRECHVLGFPSCWGFVDCATLYWDNCPLAHAGQCRGKETKYNVRMEVISDDHLRIWRCTICAPATSHCVQVFLQSLLFNRNRTGEWPKLTTSIDIGGYVITWFYLLCDGIHPYSTSEILSS